MIAQNAKPSRHDVVIFVTSTPGYPSVMRRHHSSKAFVPLRSPIFVVMALLYLTFSNIVRYAVF